MDLKAAAAWVSQLACTAFELPEAVRGQIATEEAGLELDGAQARRLLEASLVMLGYRLELSAGHVRVVDTGKAPAKLHVRWEKRPSSGLVATAL
jgi:hypothetical protein